ncbi:AraC family transcriptional regulator [Elongatibacter sediminis]|uniref:AraC family transcriptional regulator n=1 Tax=Elongatibacter sediminis TaxID=3119006 RepID=A0AAW9RPW6_9GAMM
MPDRLVWLLRHFNLRARVFQAGVLNCNASFEAQSGLGYLHVLKSGKVEITPQGHDPILVDDPSVLFFMNPTQHRVQPAATGCSMVCATFEFGLDEGNPLLEALPELTLVRLGDAPILGLTLRQLFTESEEDHCGKQAVLDRLCEVALVLVLRDLMDQHRLDVGLLAGLADTRLARAINAMHAEPNRNWTLEALAGEAGMSRARFAVHFRDTVGMTPGDYLGEWRVGLAQSMMLKGMPLKSVAGEVGYGSASALSRAFLARRGKTPTTWLREHGTKCSP